MSTIGHNRPPLRDRIFADPETSLEDVFEATAAHIKSTYQPDIDDITARTRILANNKDNLPDSLNDNEIGTALDLLAALTHQAEQIQETKNAVLAAVTNLVSDLNALCKPMEAGLGDLEKAVRSRLTDALSLRIDNHNKQRTEGEPIMTSLTLRGSSGAKATLIDGKEPQVSSSDLIPEKFMIPDTKAITAAWKKGESVPGVDERRKLSLRVTT